MRKQSEKKTIIKSVRMTENEMRQIEQNAAKEHMDFGRFMVQAATKEQCRLKPATLGRIQDVVNHAYEAVKDIAPETAKQMKQEVNAIWSLLK